MSDHADALVVFGLTGDLARKMTLPALYRLSEQGLLGCSVIGVGRRPVPREELVRHATEAIEGAVDDVDEQALGSLLSRLEYIGGDAEEGRSTTDCATRSGTRRRRSSLATPPAMFLEVAEELAGRISFATDGSSSRSRSAPISARPAS